MLLLSKHFPQGCFELLGAAAVHEEVGGDVEHNEEMGHGLETHHPQRRNVLIRVLYTGNLDV